MSSVESWVVENKLASIGTIMVLAVGASVASYTHKRKNRLHSKIHAKALTLALLSGAALLLFNTRHAATDIGENYDNAPEETGDFIEDERWSW